MDPKELAKLISEDVDVPMQEDCGKPACPRSEKRDARIAELEAKLRKMERSANQTGIQNLRMQIRRLKSGKDKVSRGRSSHGE